MTDTTNSWNLASEQLLELQNKLYIDRLGSMQNDILTLHLRLADAQYGNQLLRKELEEWQNSKEQSQMEKVEDPR